MKAVLEVQQLGKKFRIPHQEEFWALKDISFQLQAGESLGIIGHNGAGKSSLLKILSRISPPSEGKIRYRGKLASLLEVGTGFHPELSGRENIFLNGSILGMRKREIKARFEEIVAFAGVEKFLDLPVKRYSSGMYVRLAFAVAAHLDADILLIDEVLAVGDADFQAKCLRRMENLSSENGRSIIFVSHNMNAIQGLCSRSLLLSQGKVLADGPSDAVIARYREDLQQISRGVSPADRQDREGDQRARLLDIQVPSSIKSGRDLPMSLELEVFDGSARQLKVQLHLFNPQGHYLSTIEHQMTLKDKGIQKLQVLLPELPLMAGTFFWNCHIFLDGIRADFLGRAAYFEVEDERFQVNEIAQQRKNPGVHLKQRWQAP